MIYTTAQAAAYLGVCPSLVRRLAARYELGTMIHPRLRLFTDDDMAILAGRNRKRGRAFTKSGPVA